MKLFWIALIAFGVVFAEDCTITTKVVGRSMKKFESVGTYEMMSNGEFYYTMQGEEVNFLCYDVDMNVFFSAFNYTDTQRHCFKLTDGNTRHQGQELIEGNGLSFVSCK